MSDTKLSIHHYQKAAATHTHDRHCQVVFGLHGTHDLEFNTAGARVDRASMAIIAPGDSHTFLSPDNGNCLVLDLAPDHPLDGLERDMDQQRRLLEKTQLRCMSPQQSALVASLAQLIDQRPELATPGAALLIGSLLEQPATRARLPIGQLNHYIDQHLAYPLSVNDLATTAGLSPSRLHHWFVREQGCTPLDYVRQRRLLQARHLLRHTSLPIGEIAARCGYSSQSAFSQAFRRQWQRTPSQSRRQQ